MTPHTSDGTAARDTALRAATSAADVLVVGEALIDVVHRADGSVDENPGGSPANVALTLGRLGDRPVLVTALGDDMHGDRIRAWLAASDVEVAATTIARTSTAAATLAADGSATYDFDIEWRLEDDHSLPEAGVVHTGSIAAFLSPGRDAVLRLLERRRDTALLTFDPNIRPTLVGDREETRQIVGRYIALADVVKASDEDLEWLYPGQDALASAAAWQSRGPAIVVVTLGGAGAAAITDHGVVTVPGRPVDVVDTVGAGDTFMGALIHGLLRAGLGGADSRTELRALTADPVTSLLNLAATAASVTVSRPGADPPRLAELPER
ncbi:MULTISPECIES: carbohydrate kinase family protein [unclassified Microbacterium]|uniref:carbohydrate kinase family protein n=1 Tax=unclassified Microbacterium TaxID=2609290 RepID=UPI0030196192